MKPKFYLNRGRRCAQALIKSVISLDLAEKLSLEELDKLTGRNFGQITTPIQIAYGLSRLETDFVYPVKSFFINGNLEGFKSRIMTEFRSDLFEKINFEFISEAWGNLKKTGKYLLNETFDFEDLKEQALAGRTPIVLINYDVFVRREDKKSEHYLVINAMNRDSANVMDCGPCNASPNKEISGKRLEDSLMQTPLDYGVVFV